MVNLWLWFMVKPQYKSPISKPMILRFSSSVPPQTEANCSLHPGSNFFGNLFQKNFSKGGTYLILVLLITHISLWQYLLTGKCKPASFSKRALGVLLATIIKSNKHWDFIIYRVCNLLSKGLWKVCYFFINLFIKRA